MAKGDIFLPNESGNTDLRRDTEVSTGDAKSPRKTVYYRGSVIPAQKAGESMADFNKRDRAFSQADHEAARRADLQQRRQATKSRSLSKGGR